jgi:hypothetical protein
VCGPAWLTNGDGNRHAARWMAVTTTSARSERRTVVAVCGADAVGRRSGSPCQRVADAVAALRGRQARLSSTHLHVEATAGVLLDSCSSSAFGADADDRRCLYPPGCLLSVAACGLTGAQLGKEAETNVSNGGAGYCSGMRSSTGPCQDSLAGACPVSHCPRARALVPITVLL